MDDSSTFDIPLSPANSDMENGFKKTQFLYSFSKRPETDFDKKKFSHNFWAIRAIFLGKYFKKSVNTVKFSSDN